MLTETVRYKIITIQDIKGELDQNEVEAWHKLIRVLTHEIMNSVSPIVSLSETMLNTAHTELSPERQKEGMMAIHKRSKGLLKFTTDYRKLLKIPKAVLEKSNVNEVIENMGVILNQMAHNFNGTLSINYAKENLLVLCDQNLMEMAIINLVKNGFEAHHEKKTVPIVEISVDRMAGIVLIEIQDNGTGIKEEVKDQVFVPFFSTKKEGSGIGLSICRQIIQKHQGFIDIETSKKGTKVLITLEMYKNIEV